jgi:hypothetical protein
LESALAAAGAAAAAGDKTKITAGSKNIIVLYETHNCSVDFPVDSLSQLFCAPFPQFAP